jgi:protein ImuB
MQHHRRIRLQQESARARPSQSPPLPILRPVAPTDPPAGNAAELWWGIQVSGAPSRQGLEALAVRAQRFTPRVSLVPPDGLLLEVKGSLHLFGGVEGLGRELAQECAPLALPCTLALAPTPLAALAAARAGKPLAVVDPAQLVGSLAPLPLASLRWPQATIDRLARIGVRTIGQALRLPRGGFARRFGAETLAMLDRLTGRTRDLRQRFEVRARFHRRRELTHELESHEALLAALAPLLTGLGEFLEARQGALLELECRLRHRAAAPTSCLLRLAAPLADAARIAELLGERLRALALPEPVRACELRSGPLLERVAVEGMLWQPGEQGGRADAQSCDLIERLRVRLGPEAVQGVALCADHRPEAGWRLIPASASPCPSAGAGHPASAFRLAVPAPGKSGADSVSARSSLRDEPRGGARRLDAARPLWLLASPRRLPERGGLPWRGGALRLVSEPERIETGWWDGADIARDYYIALDARGVRLWVFREREPPHRWFLQGLFG